MYIYIYMYIYICIYIYMYMYIYIYTYITIYMAYMACNMLKPPHVSTGQKSPDVELVNFASCARRLDAKLAMAGLGFLRSVEKSLGKPRGKWGFPYP